MFDLNPNVNPQFIGPQKHLKEGNGELLPSKMHLEFNHDGEINRHLVIAVTIL